MDEDEQSDESQADFILEMLLRFSSVKSALKPVSRSRKKNLKIRITMIIMWWFIAYKYYIKIVHKNCILKFTNPNLRSINHLDDWNLKSPYMNVIR